MSAFQVQCTLSPQPLTRPLLLMFHSLFIVVFPTVSFHSVQLRETVCNFFKNELPPHANDIDRQDFLKFRVREMATLATIVASFPGLPCFCVHNNTWEWKWGRPRSIHHMKDVRWTWGGHRGRARYSNIYLLDLKASFLLVEASRFNHTEVWSPKQW